MRRLYLMNCEHDRGWLSWPGTSPLVVFSSGHFACNDVMMMEMIFKLTLNNKQRNIGEKHGDVVEDKLSRH